MSSSWPETPFRLVYLQRNGTYKRLEVVGVRLGIDGRPRVLTPGSETWVKKLSAKSFTELIPGDLAPCLESIESDLPLSVHVVGAGLSGDLIGVASSFTCSAGTQASASLVNVSDGTTVARCEGSKWHAGGVAVEMIEFFSLVPQSNLIPFVEDGPRSRLSALAAK